MFSSKEKKILATLCVIQFSHIADFMVMMPLGPQLTRIMNLTTSQFGALVSVYTLAAGVASLIAASFADKFDRRSFLFFTFSGFTVGTILCGVSQNYIGLFSARLVTGLFGGTINAIILAMVADIFDASRRGAALGIVMSAFSLAAIFGVPLGLFASNLFGWNAPFLFLGAFAIFILPLIRVFLPSLKGQDALHNAGQEKEGDDLLSVFSRHLFNKNTRNGLLVNALLIFSQFMVIPFISPVLVSNFGVLETHLPFVYLIGGSFSILTSPIVGRLADKFGKKKVFKVNLFISLFTIFTVTNINQVPFYVAMGSAILFFITMGMRMVPATALISSAVVAKDRGSFTSLMSSSQQFASSLASFVAGHIVLKTQLGNIDRYNYVGILAVLLSVVCFFLANTIEEVS